MQALPGAASAREACARAGLGPDELAPYARALRQLADTDMIQERR